MTSTYANSKQMEFDNYNLLLVTFFGKNGWLMVEEAVNHWMSLNVIRCVAHMII